MSCKFLSFFWYTNTTKKTLIPLQPFRSWWWQRPNTFMLFLRKNNSADNIYFLDQTTTQQKIKFNQSIWSISRIRYFYKTHKILSLFFSFLFCFIILGTFLFSSLFFVCWVFVFPVMLNTHNRMFFYICVFKKNKDLKSCYRV